MIKWTHIIIHCSATQDSGTVSWNAIRNYHINEKHWADIGYHAGIELVGTEYIVLAGRAMNRQGAHCQAGGMNKVSLGFCFIGNYDLVVPPTVMFVKGAEYVKGWMDILNIPVSNVKAHRDYESGKTCPGLKFNMDDFRDLLR